MRILIGSAGRRVYLVEWFREALRRCGRTGEIHTTENSSLAATGAFADRVHLMPRFDDPNYENAMVELFESVRPDLFFSLNDRELARLSDGLGERLSTYCPFVLTLPGCAQRAAGDKYLMATDLARAGVPTPRTVLASDPQGVRELEIRMDRIVVKPRFGSGSSGLRRVAAGRVDGLLAELAGDRPARLREWVLQPDIAGDEFGVDVIGDLRQGTFAAVLARRKVSMRAGETNIAETVEPETFITLARRLAGFLKPRGLIDVDVLDDDGMLTVIDVNPRFGGGYPFNHTAGADVPAYYVAQAAGIAPPDEWQKYRAGWTMAKYDWITTVAK